MMRAMMIGMVKKAEIQELLGGQSSGLPGQLGVGGKRGPRMIFKIFLSQLGK